MAVTFTTPTLETERLILRAPKPSDAKRFVPFYGTQRSQYVGGPMDERKAWSFFCIEIGHWVMRGYGMFVVTWKDSDAPLGIVGHWFPHGWAETEIGWVLFDPEDEGKGIAREAAAACISHAWDVLNWDTIVSYIEPENAASISLAERLGAKHDPDAPQPKDEKTCLIYRHPTKEAA